ncbi:hypothetical protein GIB67_002621 [Kingdonia uniflora]|uniref:Uncharacterized protein n=1 Tax=Kingdonia uniflora TaxID=39325 RepID=A0A7J7N4S1_9MAGN|nr:hypothetical protein GIB67_002621 [Kingdonia uniflora]
MLIKKMNFEDDIVNGAIGEVISFVNGFREVRFDSRTVKVIGHEKCYVMEKDENLGNVVLSRVRSLDGLYLDGFNSLKIKAHPKVMEFYNSQFLNQKTKASPLAKRRFVPNAPNTINVNDYMPGAGNNVCILENNSIIKLESLGPA